jgi:branched-chain amino acid transport system ATP-binding protein
MALLEVTRLRKEFGGLVAVDDVDFEIEQGAISSLIGPNGAGKTTFFNMLTGVYRPTAGRIIFNGENVTGKPPHAVTERGVGRTFQNIRLFQNMTAIENVLVGMHARLKGNVFTAVLKTPGVRHEEARARERADELLRYSGLGRVEDDLAKNLSYGDQRRLEVARALATEPKLLLLDEPSMGLAPIFVEKIFEIVREINQQGTPILLVEQNALMALDTADRGYVLETGKIALADDAKSLRQNEQVRKTYLGED